MATRSTADRKPQIAEKHDDGAEVVSQRSVDEIHPRSPVKLGKFTSFCCLSRLNIYYQLAPFHWAIAVFAVSIRLPLLETGKHATTFARTH
jgi:hypothetical protein